jgi:hypothetical protein
MRRKTAILSALATVAIAFAAAPVTFEDRPAVLIGNDKIEFTVLPQGTMIARILLKDDMSKMSPLWDPVREAQQANVRSIFSGETGHFLCVDGFGGVSKEEQAAGLPGHGEAHTRTFALESNYADGQGVYTFTTDLPIAQEHVTRTMRLRDGEQVLEIDTEIESQLGFDRPVFWAEHATIGAPFLEPEVTVVDMPAVRAKTRPYEPGGRGAPHRLPSDVEFKWPIAPGLNGGHINLRAAPRSPNSGDHTAALMDTSRKNAYVTAINTRRHLLVGWVFRPTDYPWVQNWEFYPSTGNLARGLEFATLPFDLPRRQVIEQNSMWGTLLYRWLPAKSKITSKVLEFYTKVPAGMVNVDDVRVENGAIVVEDRAAKLTVKLPTKAIL